jgi:acyl-CoA hydrolase
VNTALQVNLFGETNATMGPQGRISSPGGQVEFMTGAARSEGGKAIIAIRSTAKEGTLSTIVLDLYRGPITTPHESVTHVVTEYGVAELRGKSEPERALALINVAHPKFRQQLFTDAVNAHILNETQRGLVQMPPAIEKEAAAAPAEVHP